MTVKNMARPGKTTSHQASVRCSLPSIFFFSLSPPHSALGFFPLLDVDESLHVGREEGIIEVGRTLGIDLLQLLQAHVEAIDFIHRMRDECPAILLLEPITLLRDFEIGVE